MMRPLAIAVIGAVLVQGCASPQSPRAWAPQAIMVREGRYAQAVYELEPHASDPASPDVILDNLRLAVAAIFAGDREAAGRALRRAYPYMVAGQVNTPDRIAAAKFQYEAMLVWKGEPFEQAMAWYYQALYRMIEGDWENARAAARNMLFLLPDFAGSSTVPEALADAESPEWFDAYADRVESDLVLGYLLSGMGEQFQGRPADAAEMFDRARLLAPDLGPLVDQLQSGSVNTLIFVESEGGPVKVPRGDRGEFFAFVPPGGETSFGPPAPLRVQVNGEPVDDRLPPRMDAVDTWLLSQHPRWWSLRSLREMKASLAGIADAVSLGALIFAGSTWEDSDGDWSDESQIALATAVTAWAIGRLAEQGAAADLRYFDVLPRTVSIVPLSLPEGAHTVSFGASEGRAAELTGVVPGTTSSPSVYALRLRKPR